MASLIMLVDDDAAFQASYLLSALTTDAPHSALKLSSLLSKHGQV